MRWTGVALLLSAATFAAADEAPSAEELARRNAELEDRVRKLEQAALAEDVETYLRETEGAGGTANAFLPGGLSVRLSGEIRLRWELQDHLYAPADPDGGSSFQFAHMRTRLRLDVDVIENVAAVVELQDVRTLGEEGSTTADTQGLDLKRAGVIFREILGLPLMAEAGRFVLAYGDQRLVGDLEWVDQGRTYDGIRARYGEEERWIDAFWVVVRETFPSDDGQDFGGFYGHWRWLEAYALLLMDHAPLTGEMGTGHSDFVTLGVRIARETGPWKYSAEAAFQAGELRGDDLLAFAFAIWVGYTFREAAWQPQAVFEIDYASGDDDPADGDAGQMQTLFPTNHGWYGFADLVGWSNVLDLHAGIAVKPRPSLRLSLDYHQFLRPEDQGAWINAAGAVIRPGAPGVSDVLGSELDLTLTWTPARQVTFLVGWSVFFPGGFVEDTGPSPIAHFAYVQGRVIF